MSEFIINYKYYNFKDIIEKLYDKNTDDKFIQEIHKFDKDILNDKKLNFKMNFSIEDDYEGTYIFIIYKNLEIIGCCGINKKLENIFYLSYIVLNIKKNCTKILSNIFNILNKIETINELNLDNVADISGFICYLKSTEKINLKYVCLDKKEIKYLDTDNNEVLGCNSMKFVNNNNMNGGKYNIYIKKINYYNNIKNNYKLNKYFYKIII